MTTETNLSDNAPSLISEYEAIFYDQLDTPNLDEVKKELEKIKGSLFLQ